jgi:hypothetical protein
MSHDERMKRLRAKLARIDERMQERANHPLTPYQAPIVVTWLASGLPPIYKAGTGKAAA